MIKIKRLHKDAQSPRYAHDGDGCFDLMAIEPVRWEYNSGVLTAVVRTGLAFEIPEGYTMFVFSRSGHGFNQGVTLANSTGIIDSGYRGEVKVKLTSHLLTIDIEKGTRIAQACIIETPKQYFEIVDELSDTERGEAGFGSTNEQK